MASKSAIIITILASVVILFLIGGTITGFIVHKVDYEDICKTDPDCPENQCCLMHKGIGLCMEHCQSVDFLCKEDDECEAGTVCCISKGMDYGLCNSVDKCTSMNLFAEYVEKSSMIEKPAPADTKQTIIVIETILVVLLIGIIIWLLSKHKGRKKKS
ncbi:hypothetical protein HQ545_04675 [Candidatus Woesearchaeota archaeon]|nr:hypothetical protein [Candidatus Woesearchaeota archaeon]